MLGGDIILAVNGLDITTMEHYAAMLKTLEIGQTVKLRVLRDGVYQKIVTTIEEHPQPQAAATQTRIQESMGVRLMDHHSGPRESRGVVIRFLRELWPHRSIACAWGGAMGHRQAISQGPAQSSRFRRVSPRRGLALFCVSEADWEGDGLRSGVGMAS